LAKAVRTSRCVISTLPSTGRNSAINSSTAARMPRTSPDPTWCGTPPARDRPLVHAEESSRGSSSTAPTISDSSTGTTTSTQIVTIARARPVSADGDRRPPGSSRRIVGPMCA